MATSMAQPRPDNSRAQIIRELGDAMTHSMELVLGLGISVGIGWKIQDTWPAAAPWGLVGGFVFGAIVVMRSMWRMIKDAERKANAEREERNPDA